MTNVQARTATRSPLPPLTERTRLGLLDLESNQNKEVEIEMLNRKRVRLFLGNMHSENLMIAQSHEKVYSYFRHSV